MAPSLRNKTLLGLSLLFATVYTYGLQWGFYPEKPFLKAPVILLLAAYAFLNTQGQTRRLLTSALVLSSLGDVFLALPPKYFVPGLVSFLVAHLFYIWLFLGSRQPSITLKDIAVGGALALYGIGLVSWLYPNLGSMTGPVIAYATVLLLMGFAARLSNFGGSTVFIGALIFIASDSGIAITKFAGADEWLGYVTWSAYVLAQYLIVFGVVRGAKQTS